MRRAVFIALAVLFSLPSCQRENPALNPKKTAGPLATFPSSPGEESDIKTYDGAGHAFMNPNNKEGYDAAAAADAQQRVDRFFAKNLRAKIPNS